MRSRRRNPAGVWLDADKTRPVLRPVGDVRDVREAGLDRAIESMLALDPEHVLMIGEGRKKRAFSASDTPTGYGSRMIVDRAVYRDGTRVAEAE